MMLNKKLEKQIKYYNDKCWQYLNKMKTTCLPSPIQMSNYQYQYEKCNRKRREIEIKIQSDGKHKIIYSCKNNDIIIKEVN